MRRSFLLFYLLVAATFTMAWSACISDDPGADPPGDGGDGGARNAGELGGACFPNQTCNAGLRCSSALCIPIDDGTAGPGDSSTPPTPSDGGDAGCDGSPPPATTGPRCPIAPTGCPASSSCCMSPDGGSSTCQAAGADVVPYCSTEWSCTTRSQCPGVNECCAERFSITAENTCPPRASMTGWTRCANCTPAQVRLCSKDLDCGGTLKCVAVNAVAANKDIPLGICR